MEDITLKNIWHAQDDKLNRTLQLNLIILESIQTQKARSKLGALAAFKTWAVALGIVFVLFCGLLIYGNQLKNIFFTVSITMIMLFTIYAVVVYIKHIILIRHLNYSASITDTQKKLASLQSSTISSTGILMLQLPFHSTWFWSWQMINGNGTKFWLISVPVAIAFTIIGIWLYKNISEKNMDKKWVRSLFNAGPEYKNIVQARKFLAELEEFKKG